MRRLQITVVGCSIALALLCLAYFMLKTRPVYLVDFEIFRAPDRCAG